MFSKIISSSKELGIAVRAELLELHRQFGSPLLVGSRAIVRQQYQRLSQALPHVQLFFSVKANNAPELIGILASEGCGFDVASHREFEFVRSALGGFDDSLLLGQANLALTDSLSWNGVPLKILHSHPCKHPQDIANCYRDGLRRFVFDCFSELDKLAIHAPGSKLLVRLNVPNRSGQVPLSPRFGGEPSSLVSLASRAFEYGLTVDGLTFHIGSQALVASDYELALGHARSAWDQLQAAGFSLSILDIGGGFPVAYRDQCPESLEVYGEMIERSFKRFFGDLSIQLIAEPGRILCAEAIVLIVSIIGKQRRNGNVWYTIDDGRYGSFSGRYFTEKTFNFHPIRDHQGPLEPCTIAGPTCDGGDIVATDCWLPDLEIGDLLAVAPLGAYASVSASQFNGMPVAKQVWVD